SGTPDGSGRPPTTGRLSGHGSRSATRKHWRRVRRSYDRRMLIWIVIGVVAVILLWGIWAFNRLVRYRNRTDEGWSQIDVQLRRRYDLIPNLVASVQGYAAHEREVFEEIATARSAAMGASGVSEQASAENAITGGIRKLLAVAENYPDLKA